MRKPAFKSWDVSPAMEAAQPGHHGRPARDDARHLVALARSHQPKQREGDAACHLLRIAG